GEGLRLVDDSVRIDFENRPNFPFVRSLDNGVEEKLLMLIGREVRRCVEVNRSPVPPLRHYSGEAKADTRSAAGRRQQGTELGGDARPRLVLQDAGLNHIFQERGV